MLNKSVIILQLVQFILLVEAIKYQVNFIFIKAQLESKVDLGVNSGCGINDGIYRVSFDDGTDVCFITPGGEVSGLAYGDRKFNVVGKCNSFLTQLIIGLKKKILS